MVSTNILDWGSFTSLVGQDMINLIWTDYYYLSIFRIERIQIFLFENSSSRSLFQRRYSIQIIRRKTTKLYLIPEKRFKQKYVYGFYQYKTNYWAITFYSTLNLKFYLFKFEIQNLNVFSNNDKKIMIY